MLLSHGPSHLACMYVCFLHGPICILFSFVHFLAAIHRICGYLTWILKRHRVDGESRQFGMRHGIPDSCDTEVILHQYDMFINKPLCVLQIGLHLSMGSNGLKLGFTSRPECLVTSQRETGR